MAIPPLTSDQQATYDNLVLFGFTADQAKHAAIRYGSNSEGAANWLMDNPEFDYSESPTSSTALITTGTGSINDYRPSTPIDNEELPPLVNAQDEQINSQPKSNLVASPPAYDDLTFGPKHYIEHHEHSMASPRHNKIELPNVSVEPPSRPVDIDLTREDDGYTAEAADIQKAIEASTSLNVTNSTTTGATTGGGVEEDDEISKALALSMASLGSQDDLEFIENGLNQMEKIPARERIRSNLSTPVILRSLSPHMSSLSSYLQCLYAIPTWTNTILAWREPDEVLVDIGGGEVDLQGVWKGDFKLDGGFGMSPDEERINRLRSIQRLFSLMKESRRSFLHVQEVVKAFDLRESQFHSGSGIRKIKEMHSQIIADLKATIPSNSPLQDSLSQSFTVSGRRILINEHIGAPLPPLSDDNDDDAVSTDLMELYINPAECKPRQSFYERLDNSLLNNGRNGGEFHLVRNPIPSTIVFGLNRQTEITSLENFGGGDTTATTTTKTTTTTGGGGNDSNSMTLRNLLKIEKDLWLDRYHVSRRKDIKELREKMIELNDELGQVRDKRDKLGRTRDGKDALEVFRGVVDYFERVTAKSSPNSKQESSEAMQVGETEVALPEDQDKDKDNDGDDQDKVKRKERQERLKLSYRAILEKMESKLEEYQTRLNQLEHDTSTMFGADSWRTLGPYHLSSLVFRTGLNGRGSTWSAVTGDDGKWYKIVDLSKEEIEIDEVLNDRSGLFLDAGITLAFYQKAGVEEFERQVPETLSRAIARDNHEFGSTLPLSEETRELIDSWNLPPLESLPPPPPPPPTRPINYQHDRVEAIPIIPLLDQRRRGGGEDSSMREDDDDDNETVQNINLSPPPSNSQLDEDEKGSGTVPATPMSIDDQREQDEEEEELEPLIPEKQEIGRQDLEMIESIDSSSRSSSTAPVVMETSDGEGEGEGALRLRGGASLSNEEDDEEEDYDDEEIDEDEVELGLLKPMPKKGGDEQEEEWDIDYAVGKIGGLPKWLDPRSPLRVEDVVCQICEKTMTMLLQVNSPDDSRPHAAARSLYVFACRSKNCISKDAQKALKVWRTQMPSPNDFFPHTQETLAKRKELESALESNNGLAGADSTKTKSQPWPEWDIQAEPEPYEESYLPDPSAPNPEQADNGEDAEAPDTISGVDKEFLAFQERIEREPNQVLRFYRLPDIESPEPLWTSSKKIDPSTVPPCELCRGPREVEFQILSTLLSHLEDDNLDFDSLLVYTCLDNCEIPSRRSQDSDEVRTGWKEELIYKQDFTTSGVRFGVA